MVPISNIKSAKNPSARLSQNLMIEDPFNWVSKVAVNVNNKNSRNNLTFRKLGSAYGPKFSLGSDFSNAVPNTP